MKDYIYVRYHSSYDGACKLGKASNIPDRDSQYATGEIRRGYFEAVFEVDNATLIEKLLHHAFREFHIHFNAGTEFYKKDILTLIEPYLQQNGIQYKKLSKEEIHDLLRTNRVRETIKKINIPSFIRALKTKYTPRPDQSVIIEKAISHFREHDKGMLVLMCGVGKTLISLWITQALLSDSIVIGVPNKLLLNQWAEVLGHLFHGIPYLLVSGGVDTDEIAHFLEKNKKCIVLSTYSSCHKVYTASHAIKHVFSMKINDECHHLTAERMKLEDTSKTYIQMLRIPCIKQLSLTATLKNLEGDTVVSNENTEYFGEIIDKKCLLSAIQDNIICDYVIQSMITNEDQLEQLSQIRKESDKRLYLSAFAALKSIQEGHSHHLLIYSNNKENSEKLIQYISMLLEQFNTPDLYYSNYHSEMKSAVQHKIIHRFDKAHCGIITCVYCLGEGWDFPRLDGVVFAENMTSNIRIVQSALRASRKNKLEPAKITKIILPILNRDDWLEDENLDLKKVREVIYQMGLEDETISQKMKVYRIDVKKGTNISIRDTSVIEYDDELTKQLRLKTVKRAALSTTYEKARKIIAEKHIKSKEAYYELCERDNRLTTEPETVFKGKFTNWIDYLNIDKSEYYDLNTCKRKVSEYITPDMKQFHLQLYIICKELCGKDTLFPACDLWEEIYNKPLRELIVIQTKKKRGI